MSRIDDFVKGRTDYAAGSRAPSEVWGQSPWWRIGAVSRKLGVGGELPELEHSAELYAVSMPL